MIRALLIGALLLAAAVLTYVRAAPSGEGWHVDPEAEGRSGAGRWWLADGGDAPALRLATPPARALAAFDAAALDTPGTERLVWRPEAGRATYLTRSRVFGFPDYTSVKAVPEAGGTRLSAYARLRFGHSDRGVNRARLEDWLARTRGMLEG